MAESELTSIEWDYFAPQGVGFSGAVKISQDTAGGCCDCGTSGASTIAIYENGAAIDLWVCQGCRCQQTPVKPITAPTGSGMALIPGATLPEEVCSRNCYTKRLAAGEGGFSGAWAQSDPIGQMPIDAVALKLRLIDSMKVERVTRKQLDECQKAKIENQPKPNPDPIVAFLKTLEIC
jgi:hypothetical protein